MTRPAAETMTDMDREYHSIERALLETTRGRWFLAEHSRRSRRLETAYLEDALGKLKTSLRSPPALLGRLRTDIEGAIADLRRTRGELLGRARTSEGRAGTHAMLLAAEELHEHIWSLQERDVNGERCTAVGRSAAAIMALSAAQAQESERAERFGAALDQLATRLAEALASIDLEGAEQPEADTGTPPAAAPAEEPAAFLRAALAS